MPGSGFDVPEDYDRMLEQGLRVSGEKRDYFLRGRVAEVVRRLPGDFSPRRILDFGCGTGDACHALAAAFPGAAVIGADVSTAAISWAAAGEAAGETGPVSFTTVAALESEAPFDLCYLNGVLHHVSPELHDGVIRAIRKSLSAGGYVAIFDNNPLNPGARLVMRRIPFDRGAAMVSASRVRRLLRAAGIRTVLPTRFLFFFPRPLARLRFAERWLSRVPLGAQYCVMGRGD